MVSITLHLLSEFDFYTNRSFSSINLPLHLHRDKICRTWNKNIELEIIENHTQLLNNYQFSSWVILSEQLILNG